MATQKAIIVTVTLLYFAEGQNQMKMNPYTGNSEEPGPAES